MQKESNNENLEHKRSFPEPIRIIYRKDTDTNQYFVLRSAHFNVYAAGGERKMCPKLFYQLIAATNRKTSSNDDILAEMGSCGSTALVSLRNKSSQKGFSRSCRTIVAVYPRSLRAYRKKGTSPEYLKIQTNCIETLDFSSSIQIIILR